jgi:hypothetical protein
MKLHNGFKARVLYTLLAFTLFFGASAPVAFAQQTDPMFAIQRGYRTGYSDGYMAGYRDTIDGSTRSVTKHAEYERADRAYNRDFGKVEDYRDGYQQGFEAGYEKGFEKRSFESSLPADLKRRGIVAVNNQNLATSAPVTTDKTSTITVAEPVRIELANEPVTATPIVYSENTAIAAIQPNGAIIMIPRDTELVLEIQDDISTERSREGERFTAKIVAPSELAGATIEGRVAKITAPGRLKRRSELALSFDRIVLNETRWSNFAASLIEVMPLKGDNIKRVDDEGTAVGQSSIKGDAVRVGGSTGAGALIGGVVGGPVGVAVGAGVGAAFGVGAVVIERGKHVNLARNQQLRIKTSYETQIR